jgi:hypothetical protein
LVEAKLYELEMSLRRFDEPDGKKAELERLTGYKLS